MPEDFNFSKDYDLQAKMYDWYGPEMLFGLVFEYISEGEKLLDLGIGSGLSAMPYYLAGLDIVGLDNSPDMLLVCEQKKFASDLVFHDIHDPLPFDDESYHHVTSCGVFHFFDNLAPVLQECSRILKPGGSLSFTVIDDVVDNIDSVQSTQASEQGRIYRHTDNDIKGALNGSKMEITKSTFFLGMNQNNKRTFFRAYVMLKK